VTFARTTYAGLPNKFEAGTPHIAGAIGLGAAVDYIQSIGLDRAAPHEEELLRYATERIGGLPGVRLIGTAAHKAGVVSFVMEDPPVASLDIGAHLDVHGIAIRTGHHCCQPLMDRFGIPGTARASLAMYNTREDVDALVAALEDVRAAALKKKPHAQAPPLADVAFPGAVAGSPREAADELIDTLTFLDDWEQRYEYLEELGDKLPPMPREMKNEATRVHGCQSIVHMVARQKPGAAGVMEFLADSDAGLVRGLIAVLQRLFSGQKVGEVLAFNVEEFFKRVGLEQHLTTGRRNGLQSMVNRIHKLAKTIAAEPAPEKSS
jgi:cysteine desulfurase/selenocysteine lyase